MTKDEALKMCLEYIETDAHERKYVRHAIKEALAQPEHEWVRGECVKCGQSMEQPEQEPVTWRYKIVDVFGRPAWTLKTPKSDTRVLESQPLYTTPLQRKPLTDEDVNKLVDDEDWYNDPHGFVRVIEAAHGIKGEA